MNGIRKNIIIPTELYKDVNKLVKLGVFSNFSEFMRESMRKNINEYSNYTKNDLELYNCLDEAKKKGLIVSEKEMVKNGLRI